MNKQEIIYKLKNSKLNPKKIIVISGASLVVHDIIDKTDDIDMCCDKIYYDSIEWPVKPGFFKIDIKYNDIFEIGSNLYEHNMKYDEIEGFKFMTLEDCLKLKKKTNREKDKKIIKLLEEKLKYNN